MRAVVKSMLQMQLEIHEGQRRALYGKWHRAWGRYTRSVGWLVAWLVVGSAIMYGMDPPWRAEVGMSTVSLLLTVRMCLLARRSRRALKAWKDHPAHPQTVLWSTFLEAQQRRYQHPAQPMSDFDGGPVVVLEGQIVYDRSTAFN